MRAGGLAVAGFYILAGALPWSCVGWLARALPDRAVPVQAASLLPEAESGCV